MACKVYKDPLEAVYCRIMELEQELSKTKQALDIAVDALKDNLSEANFREMLDASRFHCIRTKCEEALAEIKQITETKE